MPVGAANHLLEALEQVLAKNLDCRLWMAQEWHRHDQGPWCDVSVSSPSLASHITRSCPIRHGQNDGRSLTINQPLTGTAALTAARDTRRANRR